MTVLQIRDFGNSLFLRTSACIGPYWKRCGRWFLLYMVRVSYSLYSYSTDYSWISPSPRAMILLWKYFIVPNTDPAAFRTNHALLFVIVSVQLLSYCVSYSTGARIFPCLEWSMYVVFNCTYTDDVGPMALRTVLHFGRDFICTRLVCKICVRQTVNYMY